MLINNSLSSTTWRRTLLIKFCHISRVRSGSLYIQHTEQFCMLNVYCFCSTYEQRQRVARQLAWATDYISTCIRNAELRCNTTYSHSIQTVDNVSITISCQSGMSREETNNKNTIHSYTFFNISS